MANTFVTLKTIARQALPVLIDNLVMPNLIHRDFSEDFHDVGDTVQVRRPTVFTAEDFNEETGVNWQDMTEAQLITLIGKKRGCLIPGGLVDNERVSNLLIDEFRAGKIGRLTIDHLPAPKAAATPKEDTLPEPSNASEDAPTEEDNHANL